MLRKGLSGVFKRIILIGFHIWVNIRQPMKSHLVKTPEHLKIKLPISIFCINNLTTDFLTNQMLVNKITMMLAFRTTKLLYATLSTIEKSRLSGYPVTRVYRRKISHGKHINKRIPVKS